MGRRRPKAGVGRPNVTVGTSQTHYAGLQRARAARSAAAWVCQDDRREHHKVRVVLASAVLTHPHGADLRSATEPGVFALLSSPFRLRFLRFSVCELRSLRLLRASRSGRTRAISTPVNSIDDQEIRDGERRQRGRHAEGGREPEVLDGPAHGRRAGADPRVECGQDRPEGRATTVRRHAAHDVSDVDGIRGSKSQPETKRRNDHPSTRASDRETRESNADQDEARQKNTAIAESISQPGRHRTRQQNDDRQSGQIDALRRHVVRVRVERCEARDAAVAE